jgi:MFS family permease
VTALAHAEAPSESLSKGALVVLTLGALDFGLEQSIILPALPGLAEHYGASLIGVGWLATGFLLASIVAVPLFGRLGDLFGKRRLLLVSLTLFVVGSLICALTHAIELAIAGRVIQGLGAAVTPLTLGLARDTVPPQQLSRVVGAVIGAANVGGAVGFLLSGILVDYFSPASIFWLLFGFGALLVVAVAALVHESPNRMRVRLDLGGAALLASGLVALLLAISKGTAWGWSSAAIPGLFAGGTVLIVLFGLFERRVPQPLVDLRLLLTRPFGNVNACFFLFGFAFFLAVFVVPQIAAAPQESGYGLGLSTIKIGLLLLPTSIVGFAASWVGGRTLDRLGSRSLVACGSLAGITGYVLLALTHSTFAVLATGSAVIGIGWGLILTGVYPVVLRNASADKVAVAVAVAVVFRNTAVSVGVTVAFVVIAAAGFTGEFRADAGYTRAFVLGAGGAAVALLSAFLLPARALVAHETR